MQNSTVVLTFFCFILETPFLVSKGERSAIIVSVQPNGSWDFKIGNCRQHGLFILMQCARTSTYLYMKLRL